YDGRVMAMRTARKALPKRSLPGLGGFRAPEPVLGPVPERRLFSGMCRSTRHSCRTEFLVSDSKQTIGVTVTRHSFWRANFRFAFSSHRISPFSVGAIR